MHSLQHKIGRYVRILLIVYIAGGVVLYVAQGLFLFHSQKLDKNYQFQFSIPFNELNIKTGKERNLNIVQFPTAKTRKGIVLYFHGNKRNIERYAPYAPAFTQNGWDVWMMDYPGFGKTTGKRTEENMYKDALLVYDLALQQVQPDEIIVYGKSLGTGVASYLASKKACQQLILETPYYSLSSLTREYVPIYPSFLNRFSFPTYKYLHQVEAPITILHGKADEVIPYAHALKLKKEHPAIRLIAIPKGKHNNLYQFREANNTLDSLLNIK